MVVATVVTAHLFAQAPPGHQQEFPVDSAEGAVLAAEVVVARHSI